MVFTVLTALLLPESGVAEIISIKKAYLHSAGRLDGELSSAVVARESAKRLVFKEVTARLEEQFGLRGMDEDTAVAVVAGLVYVEDGGRGWDGRQYHLEALTNVDMDDLAKDVQAVRNEPEQVEELKRNRQRAREALSAVWELSGATDGSLTAYDAAIRQLAASDWFERGHAALIKEAYTAATDAFSRVIELDPKDAAAFYNRGVANWYLESYRDALRDFQAALELNPSYERAEVSLENAKRYMQRYESAVRYYGKLIEIKPEDPNGYLQRGLAYWELGRNEEALVDFSNLITLVPSAEDGYINRGGVYMTMGNYGEAERDFLSALKVDPGSTRGYFNLGLLRVKQGRLQEALEAFSSVLKLDPEDTEARFNRGIIYAETGSTDRAVSDMEKAAAQGHRGAEVFLVTRGRAVQVGPATSAATAGPPEEEVETVSEKATQETASVQAEPPVKSGMPRSEGKYAVQAGAFSNRKNAFARVTMFKKLGYDAYIREARKGENPIHIVIVHRFNDKARASELVKKLQDEHEIKSIVTVTD